MSYRTIEGDNRWAYGTCERCGIEWKFDQSYLQRDNYNTELCADCRRKPVTHCGPPDDYCVPWTGDLDWNTMNPINPDGTPYMPGIRICGNQDCVRPKHLIGGASRNRRGRKPRTPEAVA